MILRRLITSTVNNISTFVGKLHPQSFPPLEIVGDSEGIPERFQEAGIPFPPEERSRTTEPLFIPSWINPADFKE
jgi:hypothetical protein